MTGIYHLRIFTINGGRRRRAVAVDARAVLRVCRYKRIFTIYATDGRPDAPEGGGSTWWAPQRWMFGVVFIASAVVAYSGPTDAWRYVPYADPVLGALVWLFVRPRLPQEP